MSTTINNEFLNPLNALAPQMVACGEAVINGQGRQWMTANITADPSLPESIKDAFPTDAIAAEFESVVNSDVPGSVGAAASLRIQRDVVFSLRRAMTLRYASPVRMAMFGAADQYAYDATSAICAVAYAQDLLRAGQGRVAE